MNGSEGATPYRAVFYVTAAGESPPRDFVDEQETKDRRRLAWVIQLLLDHGPRLARPYADAVRGPIRELRVQSGRKAYRLLHGFQGRVAVILHAFLKKQDQIPKRDLELAEARWREFDERIKRGEVRL